MKFLIITQDITTIDSFVGLPGKLYRLVIFWLMRLKLRLIMMRLRGRKVTLVVSRALRFKIKGVELLFWDELLNQNRLERERNLAWQIVKDIIRPILGGWQYQGVPLLKVWQTYLAIYISHNILAYRQAVTRLVGQDRLLKLVPCGSSYAEKVAVEIASKQKIPIINFCQPDFSALNQFLLDWLYRRQLRNNIAKFFNFHDNSKSIIKAGSVLLIASFFRHLQTLVPWQKILSDNKISSIFVFDDGETAKKLNRPGNFIQGYLSRKEAMVILNRCRKLAGLFWENLDWRFLPIGFKGAVVRMIQGYLKSICLEAFPLVCLYLAAGRKLIDEVRPKSLVLVSDVRPLEVSLGLLAKKLKYTQILISPNTMMSSDQINEYDLADKVVVVGEHIRKQLQNIGMAKEKITVAGDWRWQQSAPSAKSKQLLLISFRANPRIPLSEKRQFFQIAGKTAEQIPGTTLVIKPHPTELKEGVTRQAKAWGLKHFVVIDNKQKSLESLILASRAVLLTWSMTGFEAMMLGRPVVVVNPTTKNYDRIIPYVRGGGAPLARSTSELRIILDKLINKDSEYNDWVKRGLRFVKSYSAKISKPNIHRVINLINPYGRN